MHRKHGEIMTAKRTERVAFYTDAETKRQLEKDADRDDKTLSTHLHDLVQREQQRDTTEQRYRELNAEERLESLIADIKDIQARAGVYSVANWELLKQEHPDALRQKALSTASRRLRDPDAPAADSEGADKSDPTPRTAGSHEAEPYQDVDEAEGESERNIFDELR